MKERRPVIYVAGLPRCGSSMTMAMLDAAGVPCFGDAPAYEPAELQRAMAATGTLPEIPDGFAVKLLDPHMLAIPARPAKTILLERDYEEQARSQLKMLDAIGLRVNRAGRRKLVTANRRDFQMARRRVRLLGPVLCVSFEDLILYPATTSERIRAFLHLDEAVVAAMSDVVLDRDPSCAPDLSVELRGLEGGAT